MADQQRVSEPRSSFVMVALMVIGLKSGRQEVGRLP